MSSDLNCYVEKFREALIGLKSILYQQWLKKGDKDMLTLPWCVGYTALL